MKKQSLHIVHLFPEDMNIYGDRGNVIAMRYRLEQRGVNVEVSDVNKGDKIPTSADIIIAGGGQDSGQLKIQQDLRRLSAELKDMFDDGVVCLAICGTYQLLGRDFVTDQKDKIQGIGYFDMHTTAGNERLVGNIVVDSGVAGQLVGFENHSGKTILADGQQAFARVIRGYGNTDTSELEGAIKNNVIGTYLHGPILPKNTRFTDYLIGQATMRKYGNKDILGIPLDDQIANLAYASAVTRA